MTPTRTLSRKGYGRIYVQDQAQIEQVRNIIQEMSPYEFGYLPDNLITTIDQFPEVVYTHKFCDLCMDHLTILCWDAGIPIFVYSTGSIEWPTDPRKEAE